MNTSHELSNEDDTFRKLKRTPPDEILQVIDNFNRDFDSTKKKAGLYSPTRIKLLAKHGWTLSEYYDIYRRR